MRIEEEIKQTKFRSPYQKAGINLIYTANWLQNQQKDFFRQFRITGQQFNILRILKGQHPRSISVTDIKTRMLDKNSDVSRLLDRLTLKSLISRKVCSYDKRSMDVFITEQGIELLEKIELQVSQLDRFMGKLSIEEASQLSNLLDKVRD
ncbi:MAG TPA: MarR family transcriptional regulator [Cyclobacteriaceae bacterium]|nr:MarR family transcriptional regulator [Cyclobacteriaceae bacterium]